MQREKFMKRFLFLVPCSLFLCDAHAAGTYYNGGYQSPQTYNTAAYTQRGYRPSYTQQNNYSRYQPMQQGQTQSSVPQSRAATNSNSKQGFWLDAGLSKETAQWQFKMTEAGSMLHYDNLDWNVLDVTGGYKFLAGNTPMEVSLGLEYGVQGTDSTMVDDDITNGGYFITSWYTTGTPAELIGDQLGHALSVGTSSGGSMLGYNVAFGLTDFFSVGKTKITPSLGYRSFSYTLKTSNNYGLSLDTSACFLMENGEVQCDPAIIVNYGDGSQQIIWREDIDDQMSLGNGATNLDTGGTYYYEQGGTSHEYEVSWAGPYLALDMDYEINANNAVNARIELGLPGYSAVGDQPYRFDWAHPKSVEDSAGMGSALHFGLGGNWQTALTDSVMLSVGLTYDYYSVSGADAKTYLNGGFYTGLYDQAQLIINDSASTAAEIEAAEALQENITQLQVDCPGWVCSSGGEIESFYKSMGIRVGVNAKF